MNAINYGVCAAIGIIGAIGTAYVLPLVSRSSRSVSQQLKCSAALVAVHPLPALIIVALMARYLWLSPYGCPEDCSLSDSSGDCCLPGAALGLMSRLCGAKAYSMTRPSPRMRRTTLSARRHKPPTPSQTSYANSLPSVDSLWKKSPGTRPQCPTTRRHTTNHPRPGYSASLSAGHGG